MNDKDKENIELDNDENLSEEDLIELGVFKDESEDCFDFLEDGENNE